MTLLKFQQPENVDIVEKSDYKGVFQVRPLEPGFGLTVGNAIRRVLLSSLEGYAITSIRIEGVDHEFSTITGVIEDVTEIVLNIKQLRLKRITPVTEIAEREVFSLKVSKKKTLTAADLQSVLTDYEVLNKDLLICTMNEEVSFTINFTIGSGRGFVPAEENDTEQAPIGTIAVDSIYTPIKNVRYTIENFRVEQKTDYESLSVEVDTDGSITPLQAVKEAAAILIQHFQLFATEDNFSNNKGGLDAATSFIAPKNHMKQLLSMQLSAINLSSRAANCLKMAGVETLGDLVSYTKKELMEFKNFGDKTWKELTVLVEEKKLSFGMDTSEHGYESNKK